MKKMIILLILFSSMVLAKDYALIIAVNKYATLGPLKSVDSDIKNYKTILNKKFNVFDIDYLRNTDVTKDNIKNKLDAILKKLNTGKIDRFFIIFTGHGLNMNDKNYGQSVKKAMKSDSKLKKYLDHSGAILAQNFSVKNISNTIVIGKRDISPTLEKIDDKLSNKNGKKSFIIFDSCFSKHGVMNPKKKFPMILDSHNSYPYKNIVYIGASTELASTGKLSTILLDCFINNKGYNLTTLKTCMDPQLNTRAIVFSDAYNPKLF